MGNLKDFLGRHFYPNECHESVIQKPCSVVEWQRNSEGFKNMRDETIERIRKFTTDRDWDQFHSPANLAKSISIEANELLECFQWDE